MQQVLSAIGAGWIGTVVGILGIGIGYVLYRRSRVGGYLAYQTRGTGLIGFSEATLSGDVEVFFRGEPVPRITSSEIILWNAGLATLRGSDIAPRDAVRVDLPSESRILDFTVLRTTRDVCGARVIQTSETQLRFTFDFLDVNDGIRVAILHTAPWRHLSTAGTVVGSRDGLRDFGAIRELSPFGIISARQSPVSFVSRMLNYAFGGRAPRIVHFSVAVGLSLVGFTVLSSPNLRHWPPSFGSPSDVFGMAGLLYIAFGLLIWKIHRHRFPRSLDTDAAPAESVATAPNLSPEGAG